MTRSETAPLHPPASALQYESAEPPAAYRRPWWVYVVLAAYGVVLTAMLLLPAYLWMAVDEDEVTTVAAVAIGALAVGQVGLLTAPVRVARRRPVNRRSVWITIAGGGVLVTLLAFGAFIAVAEFVRFDPFDVLDWPGMLVVLGVAWSVWTVPFALIAATRLHLAERLWRWVVGGSVAELLVAVPTHLVVRRREECCAGMATGTAIVIGVVVLFLSFGPGVMLLYYRRWRKVTGRDANVERSTLTVRR